MFIDLHIILKAFFFSKLSNTLSLATRKYENILIIGDLNIDTSSKKKHNGNHQSDSHDASLLKHLITDITCVKSTNGTSVDVLLANRLRCFHHTATLEIGLIDCNKFTNLTKNLVKGLSIKKTSLEWFLINMHQ